MLSLIHKVLCRIGLHQWEVKSRPEWRYHYKRGWHFMGEIAYERCMHCPCKKRKLPYGA
jgi:hypothetical protein